jgi:hypothetical protein
LFVTYQFSVSEGDAKEHDTAIQNGFFKEFRGKSISLILLFSAETHVRIYSFAKLVCFMSVHLVSFGFGVVALAFSQQAGEWRRNKTVDRLMPAPPSVRAATT